ncbi:MAG: serine/threonine-protein kinase, partial [bacterium]
MSGELPKKQPQSVGQYYMLEKIAQGGMAEIFRGLAYDVHGLSRKTVCIKKILSHLSADRDFIGSIIDEAKIAVKLVHGNIAQTYDLGKVGDDYYMVMEYVDGSTLSQINKRCIAHDKLIPIEFVAYFVSEVAAGLDYMHRRTDETGVPIHIVHRDISPQNIMVSYSGTVKIIDFGIAKAAFKAGHTDSGMLKGKFAYMSPEQAYGDALDHRSDIFSLGVILHELLTGKRLFKAADSRQTIRNVRRSQVDPPSSVRPDLPPDLDRIVLRALAKDRRHRYPFASELREDLVKFLHANYPEFKPSDAAAFLQELFKDDVSRQHPQEADSKTPALIIDKTNSALADESQFEATGVARTPLDLGEFMLEEIPQEPQAIEEALSETTERRQIPEIEAEVSASMQAEKGLVRRMRPIVRKALRNGLVLGGVLIAIAATIGWLKHHKAAGPVLAGKAAAMVVTSPADAAVSMDGRFIGQGSPVTIRDIVPDEDHTITVAKSGFLTRESHINLERGEFASFSIELSPAGPLTARLELTTTPPGATVFIDDQETKYRTPVFIEEFDARKPHTVALFLQGYKYWTKSMELKGGESKSFDVSLARDLGSLFIDSDPAQSLVLIDGVPVGQTPIERNDLEPNRVYKIEVWHEGYQPSSREVRGEAGRRKEARFTLVPLPVEQKAPE